jgi:ubiquinone/menaquinone biosynthesis C-methylase UbiE
LTGADLSLSLLQRYCGPAKCVIGDCRDLPIRSDSQDIVIVHGGLHHLEDLSRDLDNALSEARRVLRPDGIFLAIEPWKTSFLNLAHASSKLRMIRRMWDKMDALATMIHYERETYERWLNKPTEILSHYKKHFKVKDVAIGWGKCVFIGNKR